MLMIPQLPPFRSPRVLHGTLPRPLPLLCPFPKAHRDINLFPLDQVFQQRMIKIQIIKDLGIHDFPPLVKGLRRGETGKGCTLGVQAGEQTRFIDEVLVELVGYGLIYGFEFFG